jgi:hypothetical protein
LQREREREREREMETALLCSTSHDVVIVLGLLLGEKGEEVLQERLEIRLEVFGGEALL